MSRGSQHSSGARLWDSHTAPWPGAGSVNLATANRSLQWGECDSVGEAGLRTE